MPIGAPRLRGQEVSFLVLDGANRVDEIKAVASYDVAAKLEIQEEGFLGETSSEFSMIYSGESGSFEFQVHSAKWLTFKKRIKDKARNVAPTLTFNLVKVQLFANGDTITATYIDCSFGEISESAGSRKDFVKVKIPFACSDVDEQPNAFV